MLADLLVRNSPYCNRLSPPIAKVPFSCFAISLSNEVSLYLGPKFVLYLEVAGAITWLEIGPPLWTPTIPLQVMVPLWVL